MSLVQSRLQPSLGRTYGGLTVPVPKLHRAVSALDKYTRQSRPPIPCMDIAVFATSSREVTLMWPEPRPASYGRSFSMPMKQDADYQITTTDLKTGDSKVCYTYNSSSAKLPFILEPGHKYRFDVSVTLLPSQVLHSVSSAHHKSVLQYHELDELYRRALKHVEGDNPTRITVLYRNKPAQYFHDIIQKKHGIMEVYDKDHSGDPGSPINGQLQGLFFSTAVQNRNGDLPVVSPFGNVRLILPVEKFLREKNNLYFTDFYCTKKKHLVTVVVTKRGSGADHFCSSHLVKLSLNPVGKENPFFFRSRVNGHYYCSRRVTVEVLYTENVDLLREFARNPLCFKEVGVFGRGCSKPDSKPKNPKCQICNLYPKL